MKMMMEIQAHTIITNEISMELFSYQKLFFQQFKQTEKKEISLKGEKYFFRVASFANEIRIRNIYGIKRKTLQKNCHTTIFSHSN